MFNLYETYELENWQILTFPRNCRKLNELEVRDPRNESTAKSILRDLHSFLRALLSRNLRNLDRGRQEGIG